MLQTLKLIKMKKVKLMIAIFVSVIANGQVVEMPELNALYRGYENRIEVGSTSEDLEFGCTNCDFRKEGKDFIVIPKERRTTNLSLSKDGEKVYEVTYRTMNLPQPQIYWGGSSSLTVNYSSKVLQAKYGPGISLNIGFEVLHWKVLSEDKVLTGKGTKLTDEAMTFIKSISEEQKVTIELLAKSNLGQEVTLKKDFKTANCNPMWFQPEEFTGEMIIIDRNEKNKALFDSNDPLSLMGLLANNELRQVKFMSPPTADRIRKAGNKLLSVPVPVEEDCFFMYMNPLIDEDPESPDFGEPLERIDPNTGYAEYIYPEIDSFFYDVQDISRIIVFKDTVTNAVTGEKYIGIDRLGFAKKYPGEKKYDVVFTLDYQELVKMDGYKALVRLSDMEKTWLLDSLQFLSELEMRANYEVDYLVSQGDNPSGLNNLPCWMMVERADIWFHDFIDGARFRQAREGFIPESPWGKRSKEFLLSASKHVNNDLPFNTLSATEIRDNFKCQVLDLQTDYEVYDDDPTSERFGMPLLKEINGKMEKVYQIDSNLIWVDFRPTNVYALLDFNHNMRRNHGRNTILPEILFFTTNKLGLNKESSIISFRYNERDQLLLLSDFQNGRGMISGLQNFEDYENLPWRKTLLEEIESEKVFEAEYPDHLKKLRKEFNLDTLEGLPFNLIGIK
jgi:hypothetical protein